MSRTRLLGHVDAVLVQAIIAGALSFAHLHDLAAAAGQTGWKAWAYPISVDLLLVAAWHRIRTQHTAGPWCWFLIALTASLGANVATAGLLDLDAVPGWLCVLVAGWPALAFFGGTLLAHTRTPAAATGPVPDSTPATAVPAPSTMSTFPEPLPDPNTMPASGEPVPELQPAVEPAPEPEPEVGSAPAVPPALITHARKIAQSYRTQTGQAIDTDTLRSRLGVPASMADVLATHLPETA